MKKGAKIALNTASSALMIAYLPFAISVVNNKAKLDESKKAEAEINERYNIKSGTTLEEYTKGKTAWIREYNEAIQTYNSWKAECDEIWSWDSDRIARICEKVYIPLAVVTVSAGIASVATDIKDFKNKKGDEAKIEKTTSFVN